MLPAEFKIKEYRFSYRTTNPADGTVTYSGSKKVGDQYITIGKLSVKPTTTKPCLYRLFLMLQQDCQDQAVEGREG